MKRTPSRAVLGMVATGVVGLTTGAARAQTTVQIPLTGVLDARSTLTLMGDTIVPWTLPTDGGNLQNAFATKAVAMKLGQPPAHALPDDGKFPADARHPDVVLNFSNTADAASFQTHLIPALGSITFAPPLAVYSKFFLFFNGAAGGTNITVTFTYADATEMKKALVPDYYADVAADDPVIFNLAPDLAKYTKTGTVAEAGHHNITGVELAPMAKPLTNVKVERDAMGNLVFWGATGVAMGDVAIGGSGGAGAGGTAGAGTGGAAGSGGTGGASGAATGGAAGNGGSSATSAGTASTSAGSGGAGTAGSPSVAGTGGTSNASFTDGTPSSDSGCGCRLGSSRNHEHRGALLLLLGAALAARRPRKRS